MTASDGVLRGDVCAQHQELVRELADTRAEVRASREDNRELCRRLDAAIDRIDLVAQRFTDRATAQEIAVAVLREKVAVLAGAVATAASIAVMAIREAIAWIGHRSP